MKRVSGQPTKKKHYLKKLNEDLFLFLMADILCFVYNHKEIKILDGPGDGKRDIQSLNTKGELCITQCKFQKIDNRSISSRETDEIAIALMKFKAKNGLFATTGKLSPQAKREYLNNFPDLELHFLEGTDIVDLVLSSAVLTSVWINNESIELASKNLALPFVLRDPKTDQPITSFSSDNLPKDLKVIENTISEDFFYPFRKPNYPSIRESGLFFPCLNLIYTGPIRISLLSLLYESLTENLLNLVKSQFELVSLRIGTPYIIEESKAKLKFEINPTSYIVSNGISYTEQEYVIPVNDSRCLWPKGLRIMQADGAAWLLPSYDICFQVSLFASYEITKTTFNLSRREHHLKKLDESLFFIVTSSQFNQLNTLLDKERLPTWSCEFGHDGKIVGWLHPYLLDDDDFKKYELKEDKYVWIDDDVKTIEYQQSVADILVKLNVLGYQICTSKKAISLSSDTSSPLFIEPDYTTCNSAYLKKFFDKLPSPILVTGRFYNFICIWDIKSYDGNVDFISFIEEEICIASKLSKFYINEKNETDVYAIFELEQIAPVDKSVTDMLNLFLPVIIKIIRAIEELLTGAYPGTKRSTEYYWMYEGGIVFK